MIVAITGATGFVGRRIAAKLAEHGHHVRALVRSKTHAPAQVDSVMGSLPEDVPGGFLRGVEVLIHCAAELHDQARMAAVNVEGARRLSLAARGSIRRWVQLSSVGVYGGLREGEIDERTAPKPANCYERTKLEADRLVEEAGAEGGYEYVILRPSTVFGPRMRSHALARLFEFLNRGLFAFAGPRGATANYVHVDNVALALELCATRDAMRSGTFNLSDDVTIEEFISAACAGLGRPEPRLRLPTSLLSAVASTFGMVPGFPLTRARLDALTRRVRYPILGIERMGYRHEVPLRTGIVSLASAWKHGTLD